MSTCACPDVINDVDIDKTIKQELLTASADLQNRDISARIDLRPVKASAESENGPKILSKMTGYAYCQNYQWVQGRTIKGISQLIP